MWQFLIIVALLVWIIRRLPTPWVYDMYIRRVLDQLNVIEARQRGIPLEDVEMELSSHIENSTANHDGTPLFRRMWR